MTSSDLHLDIDDLSFDLPDSSEYQLQVKYSYQKGKLQKPRRNRSAFIIFSSETRAKLKLDEGNLNSNEMMVKLAELWKNLGDEGRDRYENLAKEDRLRYQQELIEFTKFNPNETIHNKTKNNHVKKPCSAYGIFLKERKDVIKNQHPDYKMADVLKIVSQEWKNLAEDQKQPYHYKATAEKEVVQTKISEALARDQVAQDSLQPKGKEKRKQIKRNGSDEAFDNLTQTDMSSVKNMSNLAAAKSWPQVGQSLYIPLQSTIGLSESYGKPDISPTVRESPLERSPSNFDTMMHHVNHYMNNCQPGQVNNTNLFLNPGMVQPQMQKPMMNYTNVGINYAPTQVNPDSYIGGHNHAQYMPVQSLNNYGNYQPVQQTYQQHVKPQVDSQPSQQIGQYQPNHQVLNVDMKLFNKFMDNFASSDFMFDDPLFEKGDF